MPNLLALCKPDGANLAIKRVQVTQPVQDMVGGLFQQQANEFLEGVADEIVFGGDYKPDSDEILYVDAPQTINMLQAAAADPLVLDTIDAANFVNESIKALYIATGDGATRLLIQMFTAQQLLTRNRLALIFQNNTFREVTEPSFALDNKLVAVAENGRLKFKSFTLIKRIFDLQDIYRVATDQQIESFCAHASLHVADVQVVKDSADQIVRKLVHAVHTSNVLDQRTVQDISDKAAALSLPLTIAGGRIVMPTDRQDLKQLLKFLDDSIYEGPITSRRLMSNSKRPI